MEQIPFIIWNETFSVGVKLMDEQHQFLLNVINNLFFASQKGSSEVHLIKIINQMVDYTKFHFSSEEVMLTNIGYPELPTQKKEHKLFTEKVLDFQSQVLHQQAAVDLEILEFLKDWWTTHIKTHDKLYKEFLEKKRVPN